MTGSASPALVAGEVPVRQKQGETPQMWGRRRKAQVLRWYAAGIDPRTIAQVHGVPITYVNNIVGIRSPGYEWVPSDAVLYDNIPTYEEAWREEPLVPEEPGRMTTEQAIGRAVQFYRWLQAGLTMQEIAGRHHLSKERVRFVLVKFGLWRPYQTAWKSGTPPDLPPPEDNIAGSKPWFFRREKGKEKPWWERTGE